MDSERAAFLRSMAENPDDDVARLVFADWLDDRGLPQGEFVRLDLRLTTLPAGHPEREPLLARRATLLQAHTDEWIDELPYFPGIAYRDKNGLRFDRGVSCFAVANWGAICESGDALFTALPIRCLCITSGGVDAAHIVEELYQKPWAANLRAVEFEPGAHFDNAAVRALATEPGAANLTSLRLRTWSGLDFHGLPDLVSSPHLGRLEELELSGHDIGEEEAELVASSTHLPRLVSYTSRGVQMSAASVIHERAVAAFADAPVVRLRTLRLPNHSCNVRAMEALARGPATAGLEVLDLSDNASIGDAGVAALLRPRTLTSLRELDLASIGLTDRGVRAVAESPLLRGLRSLNLSGNRFTDEGATALALSDHISGACRVIVGWPPPFRAVTDLGLSALRERFRNLEVAEL
ncbi:MAG: TIGR02996 domain-containing protein [Planctomycetes bacterium]|nr:TIGR02996 domain-containing protein [Planctomycetota bacterium]